VLVTTAVGRRQHLQSNARRKVAFGCRLKHTFGLATLRVRSIERARLHADLVMLARLGRALGRTRIVSLAA